jgi:hypothetical protein
MWIKKCLLCNKELVWDENFDLIDKAGFITVSFHYGSRHDQGGHSEPKDPLTKLLQCDEIRAFICDDCFEQKLAKFEGWKISTERKETRII